jgi:catechol 2,3-dioxygenase-like lactoylglutathione lyase family enzyme
MTILRREQPEGCVIVEGMQTVGMNRPPPIEGIVETILYVADMVRAIAFYRDELDLEPMAGDAARFQAFRAGERQVLLLFKRGGTLEPAQVPGGIIPPHDGTGPQHIGFAITADAYEAWRERLRGRSIAIESETTWERGGRSMYFRDPDGHLLELITPGIWPNY